MLNLGDIASKVLLFAKANAPEILTGAAVVGLGATAYLSGRAAVQASEELDRIENDKDEPRLPLTKVEKAKRVWPMYIPPVLAGVTTAACIVGSNKAGGRRTATALAAYSITEKAFSEYREKVVEQIGVNKEQKVRDEIAQTKVTGDGQTKELMVLGSGNYLCCELYTMRYFLSDVETLKSTQNKINAQAINGVSNYVPLDDFYEYVGLPYTSHSSRLGWDSDRQLELEFTSTLSPDNRPCLAFDYNYIKPIAG